MLLLISSTYNISYKNSFNLFIWDTFLTLDFLARDGVCSFGEFTFVEDTLKIFCDQNIFKGCPVKFFAKIVARGSAVQIFPNFPAKRLFFLSLLAGKLEQTERRLLWQQLRPNNLHIVGSINNRTTTLCVQNALINSSQIKGTCSWKRLLKSLHWNDFAS